MTHLIDDNKSPPTGRGVAFDTSELPQYRAVVCQPILASRGEQPGRGTAWVGRALDRPRIARVFNNSDQAFPTDAQIDLVRYENEYWIDSPPIGHTIRNESGDGI